MSLTPAQQQIAYSPSRMTVAICGRRFGKTFLARNRIAYAARIPNQEVWYVAPTYRQAKQIMWRSLKNKLQDLRWIKKINESELSIVLKNNSIIYLKGSDNSDSLRGSRIHYLVCDEFALMDSESWFSVLRPMLSDTQGRALFISTPMGQANWAYDLYQMQHTQPEVWRSFSYSTLDGGQVSEEEIEAARLDLDERTFRQEFMATFEQFQNRVYYSFDRVYNVLDAGDMNTDIIYCGIDFNVSPVTAVIAIRQGDNLYVIDEIRMYSSNTQELAAEIHSRYPTSKKFAYPDPSGTQRRTSAGGLTDHTILANNQFTVKSPRSHTPVRDRINAVNSRLCSAAGKRHLFISPRCKYTIESLEKHSYRQDSVQPDKDSGWDHLTDALGYMVDYLFPIRRDLEPQPAQRWGHRIQG